MSPGLRPAFAAGVPAAWVAGDEVSGQDGRLRGWLEEQERPYVLAVSCAHLIWTAGQQERVDARFTRLPATLWERLSAGEGSQGPRWYEWAWLQVAGTSDSGMAAWVLARRSLSEPREVAYYRVYGPEATPLAAAVRVAGARWAIEEGFERAKDLVGLDQYEVRRWSAWYRHVTLALLAHAYLEVTRSQATAAPETDGGKRGASYC